MKLNLASASGSSVLLASETESARFVLAVADERDRETIYRHRHEVYARELGQHGLNPAGWLRDALDDWNLYLVVKVAGEIFRLLFPRQRRLSGAVASRTYSCATPR